MLAILTREKWYLKVVLICISLIARDKFTNKVYQAFKGDLISTLLLERRNTTKFILRSQYFLVLKPENTNKTENNRSLFLLNMNTKKSQENTHKSNLRTY